MIDIEIYDTDPKLAADIANAVADAYNIRRQEEEKNRATKALTLLDTQIKKQEGRLEAARNNMIELMEEPS